MCVCVRVIQNNLLHFLFLFCLFFENQYRYCVESLAKMICHEGGSTCALLQTKVIFVPANSYLYPACSFYCGHRINIDKDHHLVN